MHRSLQEETGAYTGGGRAHGGEGGGDPAAEPSRNPGPRAPELRVLGPMTWYRDGRSTPLGAPKHRALLGLLLIRPGRVVPAGQLVEELWGRTPPRHPAATLQTYLSHLRRALAPDAGEDGAEALVRHEAPGYVLDLDPGRVDAHRFERLVAQARRRAAEGAFPPARGLLASALDLWQGTPYLGLTSYPPLGEESSRLEQLRLTAVELHAEACLHLGEPDVVVTRLGPEVRRHPLREHLVGLLMTALYTLGRQAEALRLYERTRACLADELGVDTGAELQRVHTAILRQELELPEHGRAAAPGDAGAGAPPAGRAAHESAGSGPGGHGEDAPPHAPGPALATPAPRHGAPEDPAAPAAPPAPAAAGPAPAQPLVGRDRELAALASLVQDALRGAGHLTAVTGHVGIGKTQLVAEAARRLAAAGQEVVTAQCPPGGDAPAHWVWSQILRQLSASRPEDVRAAAARFGGALAPLLAAPGGGGGRRPADPLPSASFLLRDAVCRTLTDLAARRPLVLVVEDAHLADPASADLLALLGTRLQGCPLSVVVTCTEGWVCGYPRVDGADGADAALTRVLADPRTRTLRLGPLPERATAALATAQAGPGLGPGVLRALHERSRGNPYILLQLLSTLGQAGPPYGSERVAALLTEVPPGIREGLRRSFAALPEPFRRVLETCAAVGQDIDAAVVEEAVGRDASGRGADGREADGQEADGQGTGHQSHQGADRLGADARGGTVAAALEAAVRAGVLCEHTERPGLFSFTHPLARETLLLGLGPQERTRLHARVADALLAGGRPPEDGEAVAHHAWQGSPVLPTGRVVPHLLRAAEQAAARSDYARSELWLRRGLDLVRALPPGEPAAVDLDRRLHEDLAQVLSASRGSGDAEVEAAFDRLLGLHPAHEEGGAPTTALWGLALAQTATGRYGQALRTADALEAARGTGDPVALLGAPYGRGVALYGRGRFTEAAQEFERAIEAADGFTDRHAAALARVSPHAPRIPCRAYSAVAHWTLGAFRPARQRREQVLALTEYADRPADRALALYTDALLAALDGDVATAERSAAAGVRTAAAYGLRHWTSMTQICLGWARASAGAHDDGIRMIGSALADLRAHRTSIRLPLHLGLLAQAQYAAGRVRDAGATLCRLTAEARLHDELAHVDPPLPEAALPRDRLLPCAAEAAGPA